MNLDVKTPKKFFNASILLLILIFATTVAADEGSYCNHPIITVVFICINLSQILAPVLTASLTLTLLVLL